MNRNRIRASLRNRRGSFSLPEVLVGSIISLGMLGAMAGMMVTLIDTTTTVRERSSSSASLLKLETTFRQDVAQAASAAAHYGQKKVTVIIPTANCMKVVWEFKDNAISRSWETFSGPIDDVTSECTGTSSEVRTRVIVPKVTSASFTEKNFAGSVITRESDGSASVTEPAPAHPSISEADRLSKSLAAIELAVTVDLDGTPTTDVFTQNFSNQRN